jgi:hypothetical protein
MQVHKLCPFSYLNSPTYYWLRQPDRQQHQETGQCPCHDDASDIASNRWPITSLSNSVGDVWSLRGSIDLAFVANQTMAICSQRRLMAINLSSGCEPVKEE